MIRSALIGLVVAAGLIRPALAEEVKLGFVDLRRALYESEDGRKARNSLRKVFDQKQKELDEQQDEVKKAIEDLNKKKALLPADTVRQKQYELQERVDKVQQTYMRYQQDLAAKDEEATQPIVGRLQRIIAKLAAAKNLTVICDKKQGVVFVKPHLDLTPDLTDEVIRRYDAGEEKGSAPPRSKEADSPARAGSEPFSARTRPVDRGCLSVDLVGAASRPLGTVCDPEDEANRHCRELVCLQGKVVEAGPRPLGNSGLVQGLPGIRVEGEVSRWREGRRETNICHVDVVVFGGMNVGSNHGARPIYPSNDQILHDIEQELKKCPGTEGAR